MAISREYLALKNFIHNELKLTKQDFSNLLKEAIRAEAKAFVSRKFQESDLKYEKLAEIAIEKEAKDILTFKHHGTRSDKMFEIIGKAISEKFAIVLKENVKEGL